MDKNVNVPTWGQIKTKIRIGDYDLVGEMLGGISRDAAKMRLRRNDEEAIKVLRALIDSRENLIKEFQP